MLFSPNAQDATGYHYIPMWMAADFWNNKLDLSYYLKMSGGLADFGYMLYMLPWYVIFGPHLWLHGLSSLIVGSLSVVLIYKIAKNQYNHEIGVLASVMMMLMPFFYYYSAEALKEMVLIWLSLNCIYYLQNFILEKGRVFKNLLLGFLFLLSITMFRTFFVGIIMLAFAIALLFKNKRNRLKTIFYSVLALIILVLLVKFSYVGTELQNTADSSQGFFGKKITRFSGNQVAYQLASIPSYFVFVSSGPFPTIVNTEGQTTIILNAGGSFVRNFLMFFYLIGIYFLIKSNFRRNLFLLVILISYLFVVAYSGYASSIRMHLPVVSLILILSAVGMYNINSSQKKYLIPFLILMVIVILGWNYIKLAGRGII
jgi:4-amino-4-deoxy-L-arabinose transferase-like glycosyltransferase